MSPPFFNFNRRLPALRTLAALDHLSPARPETETAPLEVQRGIGLSSFTNQAQAESHDFPASINISVFRGQAREGNMAAYATVLNFYALQLQSASEPEHQAEIRRDALIWSEEALRAIVAAPGFERDRVRYLYDCVLALGSILARESRSEIPALERDLLLRYFIQIRAGIERHRIDCEQHPEYDPIPDYFETYARGEQALLQGNASEALAAFLETRRAIQGMEGSGTFRSRVLNGAEYAILAMQNDSSGAFLENLRSRWNLDLLAMFDQIDGGTTAEAQSLSLMALAAAETELRGASARGLLDYLQGLPRYNELEREGMLDLLQRLYEERPQFRQACDAQLHPAAGTRPRQIAETLLHQAAAAAARILAHENQAPYAAVFAQDRTNRPLFEAVEGLRSSPLLTGSLRDLLGLPHAEPRTLAQNLVEYGPLVEVMLRSLPQDLQNQAGFDHFFRAILAAANGGTSEGRRQRLEQPLEELVETMGALAREEDRYGPAYENFFRSLAESSEEIATGVQLSSALRNRARNLRASLLDFSGRRLVRHLLSADSLLSLAGGIALTELMPIGILRYARNGGLWMRTGRLTWQSELAVGLGVGVAMSTVGGIHHLATFPRPWREELPRILPALALNTLLSSAAMGGAMVSGRVGRAMFLEQERSMPLVAQHLGVRIWTTGTGGLMQLGAGALGQGILTGRWETPNRETAAETFLNMLLWDLGSAGLRRIGNRLWWRAQLGPQVTGRIGDLAEAMTARNRWLAQSPAERLGLENYLGRRQASREGLQEIIDGMGEGLEPYWNEGQIAFRRSSPSLRGQGPDAVATPDEAAPVEQRVSDEVYNVPFEALQRLWNLPMRSLPREILSSPILRPIHRVQVGPHEFFLSRIFETESENGTRRRYALALVPVVVDGQAVLKRRFFYTSNSDAGAWRCSPFAMGDGHLMKGVGRHYTQETQPVWEISEALHRLENEGPLPYVLPEEELHRYISIASPALGEEGIRTMTAGFTEEVEFPRVVGITQLGRIQPGRAFALPRGWGWGHHPNVEQTLQDIRNLAWPEGFLPDFNQSPARQLVQEHSLLGRVTFREYRGGYARDRESGRNRPLVWVMGEDSRGRAWVRHLYFADSPVNSYGVHSEIIDSGILTSKPLEYRSLAGQLEPPYARSFNDEYVDISPALTLLEPIRQYRAARGLGLLLTEANTPTIRERPDQE
ncbi:MAG: hypothetical protein U1F66_03565 [bacterium]